MVAPIREGVTSRSRLECGGAVPAQMELNHLPGAAHTIHTPQTEPGPRHTPARLERCPPLKTRTLPASSQDRFGSRPADLPAQPSAELSCVRRVKHPVEEGPRYRHPTSSPRIHVVRSESDARSQKLGYRRRTAPQCRIGGITQRRRRRDHGSYDLSTTCPAHPSALLCGSRLRASMSTGSMSLRPAC